MSFKKSIAALVLVLLVTGQNSNAMFIKTALKTGVKTAVFGATASSAFGLSGVYFYAQGCKQENYSISPTLLLKAKKALLDPQTNPEYLKNWTTKKLKKAKIGYIIAPPLVGLGITLAAPTGAILFPAVAGVATGALYAQYLLDQPVFGEKPVRAELANTFQKACQLGQIEKELARRNDI